MLLLGCLRLEDRLEETWLSVREEELSDERIEYKEGKAPRRWHSGRVPGCMLWVYVRGEVDDDGNGVNDIEGAEDVDGEGADEEAGAAVYNMEGVWTLWCRKGPSRMRWLWRVARVSDAIGRMEVCIYMVEDK